MRHQYCTYFDHRYYPRGMAMIQSLQLVDPLATITVLCLSEECGHLLHRHPKSGVSAVSLAQLEESFPELLESKAGRSLMEYYFTCTPFIMLYVLKHQPEREMVTYLDADLGFFANPTPIFAEMGEASVTIIPHRFPEALSHCESYGKFNVGWVSFRRSHDGLTCLQWWADRCQEWCYDRLEGDKFADQKYLDEFPKLFSGVHILEHPGANLAPWNVGNHSLSLRAEQVCVDEQPLLFFHFHGFKILKPWLVKLPFPLYRSIMSRTLRKQVVVPYLRWLKPWERQLTLGQTLNREGLPASEHAEAPEKWTEIVDQVRSGHYQLRGPRAVWFKFLSNFRKRQKRVKTPKTKTKKPKKPTPPAPTQEPVQSPPNRLKFVGDHASWAEATSLAKGYDAPHIFQKTRDAIRKVVSGEAVFERDSVLFEVPEYPFSTIAGLLHVAAAYGGELSVLDFGGSLGSVYFSCRPWLVSLRSLHWSVVEQGHYVESGQEEFTTETLDFHYTMEAAAAVRRPHVVLFSGSLHFLDAPTEWLEKACALEAPFLIIERTPFWEGDRHRISIQHVPSEIYAADYACWLFSEALLLAQLAPHYELVVDYPAMDVIPLEGGKSYFKGMVFRRRHGSCQILPKVENPLEIK